MIKKNYIFWKKYSFHQVLKKKVIGYFSLKCNYFSRNWFLCTRVSENTSILGRGKMMLK